MRTQAQEPVVTREFRIRYKDLREEIIDAINGLVSDSGTEGNEGTRINLEEAQQIRWLGNDAQEEEYVIAVLKDCAVVYAAGEAEREEEFGYMDICMLMELHESAVRSSTEGVPREVTSAEIAMGLEATIDDEEIDEDFWYQWKSSRLVEIVNKLATAMGWQIRLALNDSQPVAGADLFVDYDGIECHVLCDVDEDMITDGLDGFTDSMNWLLRRAAKFLKLKKGGS